MRFSQFFNRYTNAAVLAGAIALPAGAADYAVMDQVVLSKKDLPCASAEEIVKPVTPIQKHFAASFKDAIAIDPTKPENEFFQACLDDGLLQRTPPSMGEYKKGIDTLSIAPGLDQKLEFAVEVHEMNHRTRALQGVDVNRQGNIPVSDRIRFVFATEADAWLESIYQADLKRRHGYPEYLEFFKKNPDLKYLAVAYDKSLQSKPGDVKAAMRATVYAFLSNKVLLKQYADMARPDFERDFPYQEKLPMDNLLSDAMLKAAAERPGVGNYMDAALMKAIRTTYTGLTP